MIVEEVIEATEMMVEEVIEATEMVAEEVIEMVVVVTPKGKDAEDVTFIIEKETKIMKGGKVVAVKDVMEAETVTVTYAEMDGKKTAKSVTSKGTAPAAKKGS